MDSKVVKCNEPLGSLRDVLEDQHVQGATRSGWEDLLVEGLLEDHEVLVRGIEWESGNCGEPPSRRALLGSASRQPEGLSACYVHAWNSQGRIRAGPRPLTSVPLDAEIWQGLVPYQWLVAGTWLSTTCEDLGSDPKLWV